MAPVPITGTVPNRIHISNHVIRVGLQMASDKNLATLPIAMITVGTASMMIPVSIILKKLGQRKGFMLGTVLGVLSGFILGILHRQYVKSGRKAAHETESYHF